MTQRELLPWNTAPREAKMLWKRIEGYGFTNYRVNSAVIFSSLLMALRSLFVTW